MTTADHASTSYPPAPPRRRGTSTASTDTHSRPDHGPTTDHGPPTAQAAGATEIRLEDVPVLIELPDLTRPRQPAPAPQPRTAKSQTAAASQAANIDPVDRLAEERRRSEPRSAERQELAAGKATPQATHDATPDATHDATHDATYESSHEPPRDEVVDPVAPPSTPESPSHRELAQQRKQRREAVLAEGDRRSSLRIHAIGGFVVVVVAAAAFLAFQQNREGRVELIPVADQASLDGTAPIIDLAADQGLDVDEGTPMDQGLPRDKGLAVTPGQPIDQPPSPAPPGPVPFRRVVQQTADFAPDATADRARFETTAERTTTQPLRFGRESTAATNGTALTDGPSNSSQRVSLGQPRSADFASQDDRSTQSQLDPTDDNRLGNMARLPSRQPLEDRQFGETTAYATEQTNSGGTWPTGSSETGESSRTGNSSETARYELLQSTSPVTTGGSYPVFQMPNAGRSSGFEPSGYEPSGYDPSGYDPQPGANYQQPGTYPRTGINGASAPSGTYPSTATPQNGWSGSYPAVGTGGTSSSSAPVQGRPVYPRTNW